MTAPNLWIYHKYVQSQGKIIIYNIIFLSNTKLTAYSKLYHNIMFLSNTKITDYSKHCHCCCNTSNYPPALY